MHSLSRIGVARATMGHLAYTSLFERIIETATSTTGIYGAIMAVQGASGSVTITTPQILTGAGQIPPPKMCFDFAVVNADGAFSVVVNTPDGKTINGSASFTLPASPGASAFVFYDLTNGQWKALLGGAGSGGLVFPPSYTARGPTAQQTFTNAGATAVNQASITTAAFTALQKAIITYTANIHAPNGVMAQASMYLFDGTAATSANGDGPYLQDLVPFSEGFFGEEIVTITTEVVGNGAARTFGLAIASTTVNDVFIESELCRGVVQIVNG